MMMILGNLRIISCSKRFFEGEGSIPADEEAAALWVLLSNFQD